MDELEQSLYDSVGEWLHEMAWRNNYPLNHAVGLWSFFEAFRNHGFDVDLNNFSRTVHLGKIEEVNNHHRFFETSFSYDQILNGWPRNVRGTPRTFYNSIYQVFDTMGKVLKNTVKPFHISCAEHEWNKIRESRPREIRKTMEIYFLQYFNTHQEHMLMPVSGLAPDLREPQVFSQVMQHYPLDVHRFAHVRDTIHKEGARIGPCPETLVDMREWRFSMSYHPSESSMTDYFWGIYLQALQREKGYPFMYRGSGLRELVVSGDRALQSGDQILWSYQEPQLVKT